MHGPTGSRSPLLVECAHRGIASRVEFQGSRRPSLEHGEAHREGREQRGLSAAVLGEENGGVLLERKPQIFEATIVVDANLAKPESAHVTLLGGPSGESYGRPLDSRRRQRIVGLQHHSLCPEFAVLAPLRLLKNPKSVEDVSGVIPRDAVQMEECRIDFAVELEAALGIPDEGRAAGAAILGRMPSRPRAV